MFFFAPLIAAPVYYLMIAYVLAAVVPAIFLMRYIYRQDRIEREPPWLLVNLIWRGVLAALASMCWSFWGSPFWMPWCPRTTPTM